MCCFPTPCGGWKHVRLRPAHVPQAVSPVSPAASARPEPRKRCAWRWNAARRAGSMPPSKATTTTLACRSALPACPPTAVRSEEHTSELQSLMRISYAVFCLKKKKQNQQKVTNREHQAQSKVNK